MFTRFFQETVSTFIDFGDETTVCSFSISSRNNGNSSSSSSSSSAYIASSAVLFFGAAFGMRKRRLRLATAVENVDSIREEGSVTSFELLEMEKRSKGPVQC